MKVPADAAQDRSLDNQSLTVWYTLNHHHVVRPEDWPEDVTGFQGKKWIILEINRDLCQHGKGEYVKVILGADRLLIRKVTIS